VRPQLRYQGSVLGRQLFFGFRIGWITGYPTKKSRKMGFSFHVYKLVFLFFFSFNLSILIPDKETLRTRLIWVFVWNDEQDKDQDRNQDKTSSRSKSFKKKDKLDQKKKIPLISGLVWSNINSVFFLFLNKIIHRKFY
jgi:hypothetical protein